MAEFIDLKDLYSQPPPSFGREVRKYYALDPEYVPLNNGSYGTTPKPVLQAALDLTRQVESNPDRFHRLTYMPLLKNTRAQLAELVKVHPDELVLVNNATTGINTVLRNFEWEEGDVLISFSTSYHSTNTTITYLSEVLPHPKKTVIPINFPTTHEQILKDFRAHLQTPEAQAAGKNNKRVAVIDSIISNPGILLPWKEMVNICKEEGVWSIVDAAHSIGQEVDLDLTSAAPDFWVSNAHKWLHAKRACAVLYIPFRNQHVIKTSLPTSNFYIPLAKRNGDPNIQIQFEWTGTIDFTSYLTIPDALAFRKWLGGEHAINDYCHDLAIKGGKYLAELWGTSLMDPEGNYTVHMVNIELPISPSIKPSLELFKFIEPKLLEEHKVYSAWYYHNGKYWTRCSAQVYNEFSDFEKVGKAWLAVVKDVEKEFGEKKEASA